MAVSRAFRVRLLALTVALAAARVGVSTQAPPPGPAASALRTAPVDVVVLDRNGAPVGNLSPGEFRVTLDGERRTVAGLHYVVKGPDALARARTLATSARIPVSAEPSRLVVFAVDEDSMDPGTEKRAGVVVSRVLDLLAVNDRVLLVTLPYLSPNLLASQDRGALRQGLPKIVGRAAPRAQFGLGTDPAAISEDTRTTGNVEARVPPSADAAAPTAGGSRSARAFAGLMDGLRVLPGSKTVFVFSSGGTATVEPSGRRDSAFGFASVADAAVTARVVVHAVHVRGSSRRSDDDLEQLARLTGGRKQEATEEAAAALEPLRETMSASYVLQIERRPEDEGRVRRLRVSTTRRGMTVRSAARWIARDDPPPATLIVRTPEQER